MKKSTLSFLVVSLSLLIVLFLTSATAYAACVDTDGDGYGSPGDPACPKGGLTDCDNNDPKVYPGATKICDGKDSNCDGILDFSSDVDADHDGVPLCKSDCNDNNPNVYPGNYELYGTPLCSDQLDNDCNRAVDQLDANCKNPCTDKDGDGYGNPGSQYCANGSATDCNDNDPARNPGASDTTCNNIDENCSGAADEGYVPTSTTCGTGACARDGQNICQNGAIVNTCVPGTPGQEGPYGDPNCNDGIDNNCNGLTDGDDGYCMNVCIDVDKDGYGANGAAVCPAGAIVDCNDTNATINQGMEDTTCNGIDENCSGTADEGYVPTSTACGTGECARTGQNICQNGAIVNTCTPGTPATEGPIGNATCSDGKDNNCNGLTDTNDPNCLVSCIDNDNDGYGNPGNASCRNGATTDCDDTDNKVYPGAAKICDGKDNNCDGIRDFSSDVDNDKDGSLLCGGDCNDNNSSIFPGNYEIYGTALCSDQLDNDCNKATDQLDANCKNPCTDKDGDGYGNPGSQYCPNGSATDCNDNNAAIKPGASDATCNGIDENCTGGADDGYVPAPISCGQGACANSGTKDCVNGVLVDNCTPLPAQFEGPYGDETCSDGLDNNCNGLTDGNDGNCMNVCIDTDGDGYGVNGAAVCPAGTMLDCNDNNANINPGKIDTNCNGVDENCSGAADEGYIPTPTNCGTGECARTGQNICQNGTIVNTCTPGTPATEGPIGNATCSDGKDNNCNGLTDTNDPNCLVSCIDNDNDGYGNPGNASCRNGAATDCDDTDDKVYPGATKICDGKDNNCDGIRDFTSDVDSDHDGVAQCAGDCKDNDPAVSPLMKEGPYGSPTCTDNKDNNCDGKTDSLDLGCAPPSCSVKTTPKDGPHFFTLLNPDGTTHANDAAMTCGKCHNLNDFLDNTRYQCQRCHADPADTSDPLNGVFKTQYPLNPPYGYGNAPNVRMHSSAVVGTKYGSWGNKCTTCHNPHLQEQNLKFGTTYGQYVKEYVCFDNTATGTHVEDLIQFTANTGAGSFADGPPHNENICEMCHTRTRHHRRDGTAPRDFDINGNYVGHFDSNNCMECHLHTDGFLPTGSLAQKPHNTAFFNANCQLCHVESQGDIDYSAKIPDANCQRCHGERDSHTSDPARNEFVTGLYTYDIMCVDCHDPMFSVGANRKLLRQLNTFSVIPNSIVVNTTRIGPGSLGDGLPRNENICETCHALTLHNRATGGSSDGIHLNGINQDGSYCMLCHDHNRSFMVPGPSAEP